MNKIMRELLKRTSKFQDKFRLILDSINFFLTFWLNNSICSPITNVSTFLIFSVPWCLSVWVGKKSAATKRSEGWEHASPHENNTYPTFCLPWSCSEPPPEPWTIWSGKSEHVVGVMWISQKNAQQQRARGGHLNSICDYCWEINTFNIHCTQFKKWFWLSYY